MTTIADVRAALALAVEAVVKATPYQTDQVNTPQAMIVRGDISYDDDFDGSAAYEYIITVYAARRVVHAQEYLDELAEPSGTTSLKAVVEAHEGLRDLVQYAVVTSASPVRLENVGEAQYLAADWIVKVIK